METVRIVRARSRDIGFTVRRLLPTLDIPAVGPFVFLDHMGPAMFPAGGTDGDVRPHPHIGLATVTFLYEGAFEHRDSLGVFQRIEPGAVNLMIAGRGVSHSERIPADIRQQALPVEGIQMWLALPREREQDAPAFRHYPAADLPVRHSAGAQLRVLIGECAGIRSPVETPSPTLFVDIECHAASAFSLPIPVPESALYVARGEVTLNGVKVTAGELAVLAPGSTPMLQCEGPLRAMLLGGAPLDGKRFLWWNFVASDKALIEQAKADWQAGRFPMVPNEHERIPLPER